MEVDGDNHEELSSPTSLERCRSSNFSRNEIKSLIDLVDKHRAIILNKSTSAAVNTAKEVAWVKIANSFNSQGFSNTRNADSLRTKWENIKRETRRLTKNLMDINYDELGETSRKVASMLIEMENGGSTDMRLNFCEDDAIESEKLSTSINAKKKLWDVNDEGDKTDRDNSDDTEEKKTYNRSLNFSPKESSLLLRCVKPEKKHVLSKEVTKNAIRLKNQAWKRITESFNKESPQKRTTKVLRTKFTNMKKMTRNVDVKEIFSGFNRNREKLINEDDDFQSIKCEPQHDPELDADDDFIENCNSNSNSNVLPDPLSVVLNGDSGLGLACYGKSKFLENKEADRLKIELLNYKLETAKLERKRIEDAMRAEASINETKAIEASLRLRAARLKAVAAELRLSPSHPSLQYTPEERKGQQYLLQHRQS